MPSVQRISFHSIARVVRLLAGKGLLVGFAKRWNLWARVVEGQRNQSQVLTSADGGVPNPGEPVRRSLAGQTATERVYTRGGRPIKLMGGA